MVFTVSTPVWSTEAPTNPFLLMSVG